MYPKAMADETGDEEAPPDVKDHAVMQWFGDGSQAGASDQSDSEPEVAEAEPAEDVCQDCLGGDILDDEMFAPLGEEPAQSGEAQSSAVAGVPPAGSSALEPDAPGEAMHVAGESSGSQVAPSVAENPVGGASSRASAGPRAPAASRVFVPGGKVSLYTKTCIVEAVCNNASHGKCVLTRRMSEDKRGRNLGQGRPIGLVMSWLAKGAGCTSKREHWEDGAGWPTLEERRRGR